MPNSQEYITSLIVIATIIFLLMGTSLFLVVTVFSKTRKAFLLEKRHLQQQFEQEILKAQLEIQEETCNNISREIHDNIGQQMSLAKVQLSLILANNSFAHDAERLRELNESLKKAMADLSYVSRNLSGDKISHAGLNAAIETEVARINKSGALKADFNMEGLYPAHKLTPQKQLILFRIAQEAIQNILKHAKAGEMEIKLIYRSLSMEMCIRDNGNGFDVNTLANPGLGLNNIKNRAKIIGGKAIIKSVPQKGTQILIHVPNEQ